MTLYKVTVVKYLDTVIIYVIFNNMMNMYNDVVSS